MAQHKALILFKLNSHAKTAPDSEARAKSPTDRATRENVSTWHGVERLPRHCRLRQGRNWELARLPCNGDGRETDAWD